MRKKEGRDKGPFSNCHVDFLPGKQPFGIALEEQKAILSRMNTMVSSPIIPGKKSLEFIQKGILISNKSLVMLQEYVDGKYRMAYLLTYRLNQDVLEHLFGALRSKGGLNDHPTPKEFKYRLRKFILARNTEYLSSSGNVQNDCTEWINDEFSGEILTISNEAEHKEVDDTESVNSDVDFLDIVFR